MRILVADDTGALAPTCIIFLAYWGHEMEIAHDGLAALRRARSWVPDLVLSRVALEKMDGLSLTAAIRTDASLRDTAVVLAGPPQDAHVRHRAAELGVLAFLATPLAVSDLHRVVNRLAEARGATPRWRQAANGR